MKNEFNCDYMEPRTIYVQHKKKNGAAGVIGKILLVAGIGYAAYKAYDYLQNKEEDVPEFDDVADEVIFDAEAEAEDSLAAKIKAAAKKIIK